MTGDGADVQTLGEAWSWLVEHLPWLGRLDPDSVLDNVIAGLVVAAILAVVSWLTARIVGLLRPRATPSVPAPVVPGPAAPAPDPSPAAEPSSAPPPPHVFISYSHDSEPHKERVLELAQRLREDGVDARLDRFEPPDVEWASWMASQVEHADAVLCVCTATWKHRFEGQDDEGQDTGVRFEAPLSR